MRVEQAPEWPVWVEMDEYFWYIKGNIEHARLAMWKEKDSWMSIVTPRLHAMTESKIRELSRDITRSCHGDQSPGMNRSLILWNGVRFIFSWSAHSWWDVCKTCWNLSANMSVWWRNNDEYHPQSSGMRTNVTTPRDTWWVPSIDGE